MSFPSDPGRDGARPPPEEEYQHAYPDGSPHPLRFTVSRRAGRARATTVYLPHGPIETPVFMPVGTQVRRRTSGVMIACSPLSVPALHRPGQPMAEPDGCCCTHNTHNTHTHTRSSLPPQGTIKGLTTGQVAARPIDCQIILGNTYHLGNYPGADTLGELGGLHKFMRWDRNILTDSGGFQMVSLLHLANITEEGVNFRSPTDGSQMLLTPEESIRLQNQVSVKTCTTR